MTQISGRLVTRNYSNFRGVDFSNRKDEVNLYRSPDALNMWKNYKNANGKCVETRPDIELLEEYNDTIFGHFFYEYDGKTHSIVHSGTKLYDDGRRIYNAMAERESSYFTFNNILYIKDGTNYLQYNGGYAQELTAHIPTTSISRVPAGGGTHYEDVNLLTPWRINSFVGDGISTTYYLDSTFDEFESGYLYTVLEAWYINSNGEEVPLFISSYNLPEGYVVFSSAPPAPNSVGKDNVFIKFKHTVEGSADKVKKSTKLEIFDNRIFFSGNPDEPNILRHCSLNDPTYVSDLDYYAEGLNDSGIKSMVSGNNALWVLKEPSQSNTTIFYHNPTIDSEYGKVYPSIHSSISTGCIASAINFNDTICFISDRGLESITGDVTTEQVLDHRSSLIDSRLLNEPDLSKIILEEWEGYLLVISNNHIYLADSRQFANLNDHTEYEWFYFEIKPKIIGTAVNKGILYLTVEEETNKGTKYRIYTLTNNSETRKVDAYWTTVEDEFGYPQYQKTTNKKGCVVDMEGELISVYSKTDRNSFEKINDYKNAKGYVVPRIKMKKWKSIQMKFSSKKPFQLYSSTLEAYIGAYVKR